MINFNSGPAALAPEVLKEVAQGVLNYKGSGLSILELSHRGSFIQEIIDESEALVRSLLGIDATYEVCWMQGGGRGLFAMIPMNFLPAQGKAGFIDSGHWTEVAIDYAQHYGSTEVIASSKEQQYNHIPKWPAIPEDLTYLHLCTNNTIYGTQFFDFPKTQVPVVVDMSSELFCRRLDYSQFDLIFAAVQKNIGPAGATLVVIKSDFLQKQSKELPGIFSFKSLFEQHSTYNTPPVFAIYCSLVNLRWIKKMTLSGIENRNREKAQLLYEAIDNSSIFEGTADKASRSWMNVCFKVRNKEEELDFLNLCHSKEILGVKGHRSVGGFRVALYNAITLENVKELVTTMQAFEKQKA